MKRREKPIETRSLQIVARRLEAQRISTTTFSQPEQAVAWLGAIQAQDYFGALWAVGLRCTDPSERSVERALSEAAIVRTWPMRGTLHFVAAADARWMTELLAQRAAARGANRLRSLGIDEAVLGTARRVVEANLDGGRRLTRPEMYRLLGSAGIDTAGQRGIAVLWRLAQDCVLCLGPREAKQHTFVLFDEWLPRAKNLPRDEALATLAQRYFVGHGPARLADFAWWSGLKIADARRAIALAGTEIQEGVLDEERHRFTGGAGPRFESRAHILPSFDEYLVGYADRSEPVDATLAPFVSSGGIMRPIVVVDGRVVGTWRRRIERGIVVCSVAPFAPWSSKTESGVNLALERYARFLGLGLRRDDRAARAVKS